MLVQVQTLRDLAARKVRALPDEFDVSIADPAWQPLLCNPDRGKALAALKACALTSIGRGLKGGQLWLSHSRRHRNREEQLITPAAWAEQRSAIVRALSLTADPGQYLQRIIGRLQPFACRDCRRPSRMATSPSTTRVACTCRTWPLWTLIPTWIARAQPCST